MPSTREQFSTEVDAEILSKVRKLAETEGCQLQALIDEALGDLLEKRKSLKARPHVMEAYMTSHDEYSSLYKKLAE